MVDYWRRGDGPGGGPEGGKGPGKAPKKPRKPNVDNGFAAAGLELFEGLNPPTQPDPDAYT